MLTFQTIILASVGADYAVSINKTGDEIGPYTVTLSRSEASVALGSEMLRCAQHDSIVTLADSRGCHPEPQRRVCLDGRRDASLHSA